MALRISGDGSLNLSDVTLDNVTASGLSASGNVVLPSTTEIGAVSSTELGYVDGVTSALQTQLNAKAELSAGYQYHSTLYFTSSSTFTKASYPWLRAIRVKVQGAGGGGGGCDACTVSLVAVAGGGGGGGEYREVFVTDIAGLSASVTVTVGSGGSGGAGAGASGDGNSGSQGSTSSFGSTIASGGLGGVRGFETSGAFFRPGARGGIGGSGPTDLVIAGSAGGPCLIGGETAAGLANATSGFGGSSHLGAGSAGVGAQVNQSYAGINGYLYGGGGSGGAAAASTTTQNGPSGGAGGDGIVIVELYA